MNIYVGNLSQEVNEDDIDELFSIHGKVSKVMVILDLVNKKSKGFGFVKMPERNEAQKAVDSLNTYEFKGTNLEVNEAGLSNSSF
jgi:RNA recognition motif-containing protein